MFEIYSFDCSDKDIDAIISFFDINGSGKIAKNEFINEFSNKEKEI